MSVCWNILRSASDFWNAGCIQHEKDLLLSGDIPNSVMIQTWLKNL